MKKIITKLTAIALVFALMISSIIVGTEKTVYADTQSGFTLSMGTSGETADFKALCTENGFSMLQNGKMAVSLYDVNIGDELYYYSKNSGLNQKFRVTDVTENTVELLFVDHVNEMETVRIANDSRNGYAQSAFINRYATWAMTGAGKKYFYGALTDEQKGALVKKSLGYDYISNGEKIFNLSGGSKQMSITETVTGIFGPISIKNAQQNYATYDNAKKIWSVGQPYFTVTLSGYESHAYNNYDIDKGEFAWIVNSDGSLATRQWSGNSLRNGCTYSNAFTGYIVPCFSVDKEKWEQCTREYLKETSLLKAQSMTFSGIAASSELRLYNNSATERNITLLESRDGMISPYDGADLGEIPVNRTITIPFYNASGVKYNANSSRQIFISAVLVADNKVKYYGRLAEMDAREGEVDLTIPSDLTIGKKHHILLFEENASNLDNNTMSKPQIMSFTPISEVNDTVDLQELNGVAEGVTFKGIYSIGYDSTAGKEVRFVDNLCVTDGAEHLAEGGVLKIPGSITIDGEEYIVNTIGGGTYDKPFVPRDTEFVSLSLPRNIKEIKPYAFFGSKIEELTIDASLLEIGTGAFSRCKNLKVAGIKISSGTIGNRAFYDNNSIETVNLEGGITVGEESFAGCEALTCIIVKALVGAVKKGAFRGSAITELYLPNTVDAHEFSFENSDKLKVIEIDMTTLKNNVFENCPAITRIVFDENVETVEENWGGYVSVGTTGKRKGERRFIYVANPFTNFYFSRPGTEEDMGILSSFGAKSAADLYYDYMRDVTVFYNKTSYPVDDSYAAEWSMENDRIFEEPGAEYRVYMNTTAMAENFKTESRTYFDAAMLRAGKTGEKDTEYALNTVFERADASTDAWAKALYEGKASYVPKSYQTGIKASFSGVVREGSEIKKSRFSVLPVYSDAVITNDEYAENEFYIIREADFANMSDEDKTKEHFDASPAAIKAGALQNSAEKGYENVTVAVFSEGKLFTTTVRILVAAEDAALKPTEEFGSDKGLEEAIASLREENLGLKESLDAVNLQKEAALREIEASNNRVSELETEVSEKNARISEYETAISEKDARIGEYEASLSEKDARIAELERMIAEHTCDSGATAPPETGNTGGNGTVPTESGSSGDERNNTPAAGQTNGNNSGGGTGGSGGNGSYGNNSAGLSGTSLPEYLALYTQMFDYRQKVTEMESQNSGLKSEVLGLNNEITGLNAEILSLNSKLSSLKEDLASAKTEQSYAPSEPENTSGQGYSSSDYEYSTSGRNHSYDTDYSYDTGSSYPYYDYPAVESVSTEAEEHDGIQNTSAPTHVHIADTTVSGRARVVPMGERAQKERIKAKEEMITEITPNEVESASVPGTAAPEPTKEERKTVHADLVVAAKGISIVALILAIYAILIRRNRKKHYEALKSFLE